MSMPIRLLLLALVIGNIPSFAHAQYFGQSKVDYTSFDFKTLISENFKLYYYGKDSLAKDFIHNAERWYSLHQRILKDTIKYQNPIILYSDHADFQQNNVISGISPGTGGVTESTKNRVIMPYTFHKGSTQHVLGHELVHAFQYNTFRTHDSLSLNNFNNIPLWIIEGMAEFLSIGRLDPNTAMWIRDAVQGDFFPSIDILSRGGYFPYRYGHAFWAFVAGTWGDEIVMDLFINIGQYGLEKGLYYTLGYNIDTLSRMWREVSEKYYRSYMEGRDNDVGEVIFDTQNAGRVNIAPAVSPDGRFLAFFSEKDLLSIDLFIADATNKRINRKISSLSRASHIDYISLLESAAAWSPDSKQLATITYSKGRNAITLINAKRGNVEVSITLDSIKMMLHPSYSPDGRFLAFSGMNEGVSNIYILNLATQEARPLTRDKYAYMHPSWDPTGKHIVVATDRMRYEREGNFNLAIIEVESGKIEDIPAFVGATNTNPIFDSNNGILFLSDRDGFRNLYKYDMLSQRIYLLTDLKTGISGITKYSQAITYSHTTSELYYTLYRNQQYTIYKSNLKNLKYILIENDAVDAYAGYLPPRVPLKEERVSKAVKELQKQYAPSKDSIKNVRYRPQFSLQTIQSTGFGLSANSGIGTTLTTGILMYFSDIIRNNDLYTVVSVNGEIYDVGAQVLYLNKKHRIDWGVRLGHIPLLTSGFTANNSSINGVLTRELNTNLIRTFIEQAYLTAYYPFSKALRLEASVGLNYYHYRIDQFKDIYILNGNAFQFLDREPTKAPRTQSFTCLSNQPRPCRR